MTADDLSQAGYQAVAQETASANRFQPPTVYFRVGETSDASSDSGNLVVISDVTVPTGLQQPAPFAYGTKAHAVTLGGVPTKESTIYDGRTLVIVVKNGHYLGFLGPTAKKVEALAGIIVKRLPGS